MTRFAYRGFSAAGGAAQGELDAASPKEARERLARDGVLVERIGIVGAATPTRESRPGLARRAELYTELGSLVRAGLPLDRALALLLETPGDAGMAAWIARLRDRVREGATLADALDGAPGHILPFEAALVGVGERTGELAGSLAELGRALEERRVVQERLRAALTYPAFVAATALLIAAGMFGLVIPWAAGVLREGGGKLPWITEAMLRLGWLARWLGPPLAVLLAGGALWLRARMRVDRSTAERVDRLLLRAPFLGPCRIAVLNQRFAHTLGALLRGGLPVVDGLSLAARATGSPWVESCVARQAERVRHGVAVADAIQAVPPLAGGLPGWIRAGEASGDLAGLLTEAAARFGRLWESRVNRLMAWIGPVLVLLVGVLVLVVALSVLLPILSMSHALR